MSIWSSFWGRISGGWKTHGPNASSGFGAFASDDDSSLGAMVNAQTALNLSAVWACANLRAETIGSLPLQLRDKDKNIIDDHPLYSVIHDSPNAMQTAAEFWSMAVAHLDMYGNAISVVTRRNNGDVISLEPVDFPCEVQLLFDDQKRKHYYQMANGDKYDVQDILHLRSFAMRNGWGIPRIEIGRQILAAQLSANTSAARAFQQSMKIGGFFKMEQNLDDSQLLDLKKRLEEYGKPENAGKMMALLKGMEPVGGADFRIKPAEAELLQSRFFGIEEICRIYGVPPQLIGHSDKSSSWASSLEQINLFFLMYSLQPSFVRIEQRVYKTLLTNEDRGRKLRARFNIQALLRADNKTQSLMFASALQNGYYNRDEVRDLLDRAAIPGGDQYTIQMNMQGIGQNNPGGATQ